MKSISVNYQLWVRCTQEVEVPDDYVIPENNEGYEVIKDLRKKYPDLDIWDDLPDSDGDDTNIHNHIDYVEQCGVDIQQEGIKYTPEFSINEN